MDQWSEQTVAELKGEKPERVTIINPFSRLIENVCGVNLINRNDKYRKVRGKFVTIALVSMPNFPFEETTHSVLGPEMDIPGVDKGALIRSLVSFRSETAEHMFEAFSEALYTLLENGDPKPDIICFNELAFPSEEMIPMQAARELAAEMSQAHEVLIVAGSAHDARSFYNTGYVFRPGGPKTGESFHKTVSARSVGELISAPASRKIAVVNFAGLKIAMMICLDVIDYSTIASIVKVGDGVDVLLVPCYTEEFDKMVKIGRFTSKALPGIVAMVNADLPAATAKCCQIARFGVLEAPAETEKLKKSGASVSRVVIDIAAYQAERTALKDDPDPTMKEMELLFGRRDLPL